MGREITFHQTGRDFHDQISIKAGPGGLGGAPAEYRVASYTPGGAPMLPLATLKFQDHCVQKPEDINGLTNEILLAIVLDRLDCFQEGQFPCAENAGALRHVRLALQELHHRTRRRKSQGVEGQLAEPTPGVVARPRLRREAYQLFVGDEAFDVDELRSLGKTMELHTAIKTLQPPLTFEELVNFARTTPGGNEILAHIFDVVAPREKKAVSEPKKAEKPELVPIIPPRVRKTDTDLVIFANGKDEVIPLKSLEAWGGWSRVEHAVKAIVRGHGQALEPEELRLIESCATGRGGKSGLAEFAQAYKQHVGSF